MSVLNENPYVLTAGLLQEFQPWWTEGNITNL